MVCQFDEFSMCSSNVAELGGSKLGKIRLETDQSESIKMCNVPQLTWTSNRMIGSLRPCLSRAVTLACNLY